MNLNNIPGIINKVFPIPGRFKSALSSDIAELSRMLTNAKGDRSLSYLSRPNLLTAYLYYFMPWNIYRLNHILPNLEISLNAGDIITDIGCGPLTFTSALWIARPSLREIPLEFNCMDRSNQALEAGIKFFISLCETENAKSKWKINLIKEDIDFRKTGGREITKISKEKKASLVCAVNFFNEQYERIPHNNTEKLRKTAAIATGFLLKNSAENASILTIEPGIPQSGKFISLLRGCFLEQNHKAVSPCAHNSFCPLCASGKEQRNRKQWCHFAFDAKNAPAELHRLSVNAGLPKDRLTLSYLYIKKENQLQEAKKSIRAENHADTRVISDIFRLQDDDFGCYGCSEKGLLLIKLNKIEINKIKNGNLVKSFINKNNQRDIKSGALIAGLTKE